MDVTLTPELEQFVAERVTSGRYRSAEDVVRAGLLLLQEREQEQLTRLAALQADIDEGIASIERGEGAPGMIVFKRLRARRAARDAS